MRKSVMVFFALGFLPILSTAGEQDVQRGERVRVETATGERFTGRVVETGADAITIALDDGGSRSIPRADLASIESGRGRSRSRGAWSKAKWGALIGAVPGAISLGIQHEQVGEDGTSVAGAAALGAWSGGLFGGLIGAAIGALSPGEEWVKVSPRVQLVGRDRGFSLSFTLEF